MLHHLRSRTIALIHQHFPVKSDCANGKLAGEHGTVLFHDTAAGKVKAILGVMLAILMVSSATLVLPASASYTDPAKIVYLSKYSTIKDLGFNINRADRECGAFHCEIIVDIKGTISTPVSLHESRKLVFQSNTYFIAAQISLSSNDELAGDGIGKTVFIRDPSYYAGKGADKRSNPPADFNNLRYAYVFTVNNRTNVLIHDFTIDGNDNAIGHYRLEGKTAHGVPNGKMFNYPKGLQNEIFILNSDRVTIEKIKLQNPQQPGIAIIGSVNVKVENSELSADQWNADAILWAGMKTSRNIQILKNYIHGASSCAIYLEDIDGGMISSNTIDKNRQEPYITGEGGQVDIALNTANITISNNTITNAGYIQGSQLPKTNLPEFGYGLEIHGSHLIIANNTIQGNSGNGIHINDNHEIHAPPPHDITIYGNTITGNGYILANIYSNPLIPFVPIREIYVQSNLITGLHVVNNTIRN